MDTLSHTPNDPVDYIAVTHETYDKLGYGSYRWANEPDPVALSPLPKPLADCKLALIASGGIYAVGQVAFNHKDDLSFRRIPTTVATEDLRTSHFAYDMTAARQDPNVVLPLAPLRQLVADGELGSLTEHALTFMGGIYSQRKLREQLIPEIVANVQEMGADIALLVPV